jgi:hypothetical protein
VGVSVACGAPRELRYIRIGTDAWIARADNEYWSDVSALSDVAGR